MKNNKPNEIDLELLYKDAILFTKSHYENFPVLSFFVPKKLRKYVAVVYQFARHADDIADEGNISDQAKLEELNSYELSLNKSFSGEYKNNYWKVFADTVAKNNLSTDNFGKLLVAFKQDLEIKKYQSFEELLKYCKNSADPVGRIILELYGIRNAEAVKYSDAICTALQLTNFYQDIKIDFLKGRTYLPADEIEKYAISNNIESGYKYSVEFYNFMKFQIDRTKEMFYLGRNVLKYLPCRLKFQILVTIKGGEGILRKIENQNYDVITKRPVLTKLDFIKIFLSAIIFRR